MRKLLAIAATITAVTVPSGTGPAATESVEAEVVSVNGGGSTMEGLFPRAHLTVH